MRKLLLAVIILLVFASGAYAFPWSLQIRGFGGANYPQTNQWHDLYGDTSVSNGGVAVDAAFGPGFGPYFSLSGAEAKKTLTGPINLRLDYADVALGLQFRYPVTGWFAPAVFGGGLFSSSTEVISDAYFRHEMKCAGIGYEAGLDLNFYPFFWSQGAASGLGFFVDALYQYRPLENMGKLTDISGWGFRLGIEYRWDFGRPTARPTTVPPPEPTPSPVPEAPPPPPPPPR